MAVFIQILFLSCKKKVHYKQMLRGMFARFRLRACGLKSHNGFSPNNRGTLPAQCVVAREKTRYTLFFIVKPKRKNYLRKNYSMFDSPTVQSGIDY